jgi:hypothetical protein
VAPAASGGEDADVVTPPHEADGVTYLSIQNEAATMSTDNPNISPEYLDDLRRLNRHEYFEQIYGRFEHPKGCPFCGNPDTRFTGTSIAVAVKCCECLATGPVAYRSQGDGKKKGDIENEAIERWNACPRKQTA